MEVNAEIEVISIEASRFQVSVLPFYVYASALVSKDGISSWGHGFDRIKSVSRAKARSEAIERWFFYYWQKSGISPFTNEVRNSPESSTGFAAGPSREFTNKKAFYEFCERSNLQRVADGLVKLKEVPTPPMGFLFRSLLSALQLNLRCFIGSSDPKFSFSVVELAGGVLFGSAYDDDIGQSIYSSVQEAVKKLPNIEFWCSKEAENIEASSFLSTARYWLSDQGKLAMADFLNKASRIRSEIEPLCFDPKKVEFIRTGSDFVSYYSDSEVKLPILGDVGTPLL